MEKRWSPNLSFITQEFVTQLEEVTFEENELAYLALTARSELTYRDRIAYFLHEEFYKRQQNILVARELPVKKRNKNSRESQIDLTVIEYSSRYFTRYHHAIIECKCLFTTDILLSRNIRSKLINPINKDFTKNIDVLKKFYKDGQNTKQYSLIFLNHLVKKYGHPKEFDSQLIYGNIIKFWVGEHYLYTKNGLYYDLIDQEPYQKEVVQKCIEKVKENFPENLYSVYHGQFSPRKSEAFFLDVETHFILIEKHWCKCVQKVKMNKQFCENCNLPII